MFRFSFLCCLVILCGGCWERKPNPPPVVDPPSAPTPSIEQTPQQILEKMAAAYQSVTSYADHGEVQIVGQLTQPESEPIAWPCTVAFRAPGNLRLEVNEGILVSDGTDVFAQVRRHFGQVLKFPTPEKWTLDVLFKDVYLDEAMNLVFPKDIVAFPPQTVLLFADDPLKTFLPEGAVAELLAPQPIDNKQCDRVQVTHQDKKRIFWIEQETGALLRLDYLVEGLPLPPGVESIRLIRIDMSSAAFDVVLSPEAFKMEQPVDAVQVDEFRPIETTLLGQTVQNPETIVLNRLPLTESDEAEPVSLANLSGETVVLCFWTTQSEPSRDALAEMQKAKDTLSTNERVRFFAVNLDRPLNESLIEGTFSDLGFSTDVYRVSDQTLDALGIDSFPMLQIVGPDGCVEFFFRGIVPAAMLGKIVRDIHGGGKPHQEELAFFEQIKAEYQTMLASMAESGCFAVLPPPVEPPQPQEAAPLRWPTALKLTERWKLQDLKNPGNIVVLPGTDGAAPSLLIPCEGNSLALLDLDGKIIKKEKPSGLQTDELLNIVRIGTDSNGKRFVGVSSVGGHSVHILDEDFATLFSYSPARQSDDSDAAPAPEEVIADFRLGRLRENGTLILLLGLLSLDEMPDSLRAVDFQGQELWRNETVDSPFQVGTIFRGDRLEFVAIHSRQRQGTLLRFDEQGGQLGELAVEGDWQIRWFDGTQLDANGNSLIVAILVSSGDDGSQFAGLDEAGTVLWSVPTPSGEHQTPIEQIIVGNGVADWIVPTVDGSILFIDRNGTVIDSFVTGQTLSGVAVLSWENRRLLVVANGETVTAWEID